ncbi:two-component system regulatory protein YycI [Gemella cuniculi]|uniref:two-component system regulatory protein YycI n=1 Tax=Gemella cuniculi TaxID=150240 RepID=UPI0003F9C497|nr:two-component system regulatory protein YycI [Gemella cuniculi]
MNWGKIKTLFIYLFVVLNIILLIFYMHTVYKNKTEIVQEKEIIEKSMKSDNITVEEGASKKENLGYVNVTISNFNDLKRDIPSLKYEIETVDKASVLKVTSDYAITNVNKNNYRVDLDTFLLEKFKSGIGYVFSSYDVEKKEIIYEQTIDGIRVFDNKNARIVFSVDNNGDIKYFEQTAVANIRKDKNEVLTAQSQAINRLYHEDLIPKNSKVKATLGYYTYISQTENQVLIPTWNIEINTNDGDSIKNYYVDAINLNILNRR